MIGSLTGVLAARENEHEFFTSVLYPFVVDESMSVGSLNALSGIIWENPNDDVNVGQFLLLSGTLNETIVYRVYNEPLAIDNMAVSQFSLLSGTLTETIVYKVYNEPLAVDDMSVGQFSLLAGTLDETIVYQVYNNWATESVSVGGYTIMSGTLE